MMSSKGALIVMSLKGALIVMSSKGALILMSSKGAFIVMSSKGASNCDVIKRGIEMEISERNLIERVSSFQ